MSNPIRRCATNPVQAEYSLCGDAMDISAIDDDPDCQFDFAAQGESITCKRCCDAIREIKALRNPLRPRKPGGAQ